MPGPTPILLLVRELGLGGSERQMTVVARGLDRDRFEPHVGCFRPDGMRGEELKSDGVPVTEFPVRSFKGPSALKGALSMAGYIHRHGIRLVHSFDVPMDIFAAPVARLGGAPAVLTSQRAHRGLTPGIERRLLRFTDGIADAVVVNCEHMRRHLIDDEGVPPRRIELCYNGIDLDGFSPRPDAPRLPELADADVVIGVVCGLRPEKGLPTLLDAFARISRRKAGLKLAIVGDGPLLPELRRQAGTLGLAESCVFLSSRPRVADCLRSIDVFVLPSLSEALSNSLMEAMACGCCAVASRVGGNPELVSDGATGLLFIAGDADDLASQLSRVIDDDALRLRLAQRGAEFIRNRFSQQRSVSRMQAIYDRVLARISG